MAEEQNGDALQGSSTAAELAQAFKDLDRGEQAASRMESRLSDLESRIDQLLAQADSEKAVLAKLEKEADERIRASKQETKAEDSKAEKTRAEDTTQEEKEQ
ncbi:hypothetical protein K490DRAFT_61826 [Saccharata proteae CBS 121410]|uniref:Uncharacterized protein n=1 Tax=Saccharata proteae CBS 121410 TaxID=1314787 RepID=A0A9P4M0T2_9PEZI|nr:hypothetical protein K490DRAFT_61826 [Saccharata proteae CBS 121410]